MLSIGFSRLLQAPRTLNLAEPLQNSHSLRLLARMVLVDAPNGRQCCRKMLADRFGEIVRHVVLFIYLKFDDAL